MDERSTSEREAFLRAIKENPLDVVNRKVYADWLDEHDEPEEADFFRSWTLDKHLDAEQWLKEYASNLTSHAAYGNYFDDPDYIADPEDMVPAYTYEQLLNNANEHLDNGETFRLPFDLPYYLYDVDQRAQFWKAFQTVTGRRIPEEQAGTLTHIFYCSC